MAERNSPASELAERYFEENIAPDYIASGVPDEALSHYRKNYVKDVGNSPAATQQIREHYGVSHA